MTLCNFTAQPRFQNPHMLEIVINALMAKGWITSARPVDGPGGLKEYYVEDFYLEQHSGGWVANFTLMDLGHRYRDTAGTPDASPYPDKRSAFLAGAALLCEILTGLAELPFFEVGDKLMVAGYDTGGHKGMFLMTRDVPWA